MLKKKKTAGGKDFGELVLILGDMCVPDRAEKIPEKLEKLCTAGQVKQVFCTGNLCSRPIEQWMQKLAPILHIVKGDLDDDKKDFPFERRVKIGNFEFALIHGHQIVPWGDIRSLSAYQRKLGVDVLISGHTHKAEVIKHDGGFLLNPGSLTGAFNATESQTVPSFMALAVRDSSLSVYLYTLEKDKVAVTMKKFEKKT
mmetsp:Transcript_4028/g.9488  ORF Transcript_4028/g.9488 Transcript_4028/m.9488 type:complete len:199 (-) Transcript_4028:159-755(-)